MGSGCLGILSSHLGSEDVYAASLECWSISVGEAGGKGNWPTLESITRARVVGCCVSWAGEGHGFHV